MIQATLQQATASLNQLGETSHTYAERIIQAVHRAQEGSGAIEKVRGRITHKGNTFAVSTARGAGQTTADVERITAQCGTLSTALQDLEQHQLSGLESHSRDALHSLEAEYAQNMTCWTTEGESLRMACGELEQAFNGLSKALLEITSVALGTLDELEAALATLQSGFERMDTALNADLGHQVQEFADVVPQRLNAPFATLHLELEGPVYASLDQTNSLISHTTETAIQGFVAEVTHAADALQHQLEEIFSTAVSACETAALNTIQSVVDDLVHSVLIEVGQEILVSLGVAEAGAALAAALIDILPLLLAARAALKVIDWLLENIPLLKEAINFLLDCTPIGWLVDLVF